MEKLVFHKTLDNARNRVIIPKFFVDKHGKEYYMEVYENKIILIPKKKEK